jgi:hypothetical protein
MGVIYVDGLEEKYQGHRYCEPGHTTNNNGKMIDYDTWFWSVYAHYSTPSEGPADPNNPYPLTTEPDTRTLMLEFLFPNNEAVSINSFSAENPPWYQPGMQERYPTFEKLMEALLDE